MREWGFLQAQQDRCEDRGDNQASLAEREKRLDALEKQIDELKAMQSA